MTNTEFSYIGSELDVFALAANWKRYWISKIKPFLGTDVLEVGTGIGSTAHALRLIHTGSWLGLEPDADLLKTTYERQRNGEIPQAYRFRQGTIEALAAHETFDSALYIDVLEHIEWDQAELQSVGEHVRPGGYIIVLSPAYPMLFSEFDHAIGHYRRYTLKMLAAIAPPGFDSRLSLYLDSIGLLTSLSNRLFLKSSSPTRQQILFWDRLLIPIARFVDPLIRYSAGRSVLQIWQKQRG